MNIPIMLATNTASERFYDSNVVTVPFSNYTEAELLGEQFAEYLYNQASGEFWHSLLKRMKELDN